MNRFLIWGGGGHGKVVADAIRSSGHAVAGFVDADPLKLGGHVEPGGGCVVQLEEEFLRDIRAGAGLGSGADAVALAIGDNRKRLECLRELEGVSVPPVVHPASVLSPSCRLGDGTVVFAGVLVNAAAMIGRAVILNTGCIVEHDCRIADGVHLSPRATLAGGVSVGRRSWIGAGATVIPRIDVGEDVTIGAGAVVIEVVSDGLTMVGVPARPIHARLPQ